MNRNQSSYQFEDIDNPWRRFPFVLIASLILWGFIMWGVGLLLGDMAEQSIPLNPIDAQLVEIPAPIKHTAIPKPSVPKPIRQPVTQPPKQIRSEPQAIASVAAPAAPASGTAPTDVAPTDPTPATDTPADLSQVPAGTDVVVVNAAGNSVPLVSQ